MAQGEVRIKLIADTKQFEREILKARRALDDCHCWWCRLMSWVAFHWRGER